MNEQQEQGSPHAKKNYARRIKGKAGAYAQSRNSNFSSDSVSPKKLNEEEEDVISNSAEAKRRHSSKRTIKQKDIELSESVPRGKGANKLSMEDSDDEQEQRKGNERKSNGTESVRKLNERYYSSKAVRPGNRQSGKKSGTGLESSPENNSEYNLADSSNSTPEHMIHTVVAAGSQNSKATARLLHGRDIYQVKTQKQCMFDSPQEALTVTDDDENFTPETPQTHTELTTEGNSLKKTKNKGETSPDAEVTDYTNGNMAELLEAENEALKRERQEFMYEFEGAMTVIQEADETADEMTMKHSDQSSALHFMRFDSMASPLDRMSKEPVPNALPDFTLSPRSAVMKQLQCSAGALAQQQKNHLLAKQQLDQIKRMVIRQESGTLTEDSQNQMSFDDASKPVIMMSLANEPKSMAAIDGNSTTFSKLSELTKNAGLATSPNRRNARKKSQSPKKGRSPKKQSSGGSSSSNLKSYLQRQKELLQKHMVPQDTDTSRKGPGQHMIYRSPERPPQPKNWSQVSIVCTATAAREQEVIKVSSQQLPLPKASETSYSSTTVMYAGAETPISPQKQSQSISPPRQQPSRWEPSKVVNTPLVATQSSSEVDRFSVHLQSLNKSILHLKEDVKERHVLVFKETRAFNVRQQKSPNGSLEEKLDYEFLERVMQVYAFFTSCLNLVLQNDHEAPKLKIMQRMIEKYITDLKMDMLVLHSACNDFSDLAELNLSSINPNFNSVSDSPNSTLLNIVLNAKTSVSPSRIPIVETSTPQDGLSNKKKLLHLQALLQIATQVLQLNSLKHRLITNFKNPTSTSIHSTSSHELGVFGSKKASPTRGVSQPLNDAQKAPAVHVLANQAREQQSQSPVRIQFEQKNEAQGDSHSFGKAPLHDVYYNKMPLKTATQMTQMKKAQSEKTNDGQFPLVTKNSEEIISTNMSTKLNETVTPKSQFAAKQRQRRNHSDSSICTPSSHEQKGASKPAPYQRWSEQEENKSLQGRQQATDTYFSTLSGINVDQKIDSAPKRPHQEQNSIQLINLEKVAVMNNTSFRKNKIKSVSTGSTAWQTNDQQHQQQASISSKDNGESFVAALQSPEDRIEDKSGRNRMKVQSQGYEQERACEKVEYDSQGNVLSGTQSFTSSPNRLPFSHNQQMTWRTEESLQKLTGSYGEVQRGQAISMVVQETNDKNDGTTYVQVPTQDVQQIQTLIDQFYKAAKVSKSPKTVCSPKPVSCYKDQLNRQKSQGTFKHCKTSGMPDQSNQTISDVNMSAISHATLDQYSLMNAKVVKDSNAKTKKMKKDVSKLKVASMAVVKKIFVFNENLSDMQAKKKEVQEKRENVATQMVKTRAQSYLIQKPAQALKAEKDCLSEMHKSAIEIKPEAKKLHTTNSCQQLPESRMKRALKGVINAQEVNVSGRTPKKTNSQSKNSSGANITANLSVTSPKRSMNSHLRNNNASPKAAKMNKVQTQQQLQTNNWTSSQKVIADPLSPSNPVASKRMAVNQGQKESNFLLKQKIVINPEKMQVGAPKLLKPLKLCSLGAPQEKATARGTQQQKLAASVNRKRSPSQKSLSQAFSAIAKAISKRQSQAQHATNSSLQSKAHSVV